MRRTKYIPDADDDDDDSQGDWPSHPQHRSPSQRIEQAATSCRRNVSPTQRVVLIGLVVVLIATLIIAFVRHAAPSSTVEAQPTATIPPHVLYQADWSHGADGWTLPPHWQVSNGQLTSDGNATQLLTVPYVVTAKNYEIDLDIKLIKPKDPTACSNYALEGVDGSGAIQFLTGVQCVKIIHSNVQYGFSEVYTTHGDNVADTFSQDDYIVPKTLQTHIIQVRDNNVKYCPGNTCMLLINSTTPLWPVHLVIQDQGFQFTISRLVIKTL